MKHASVFRCLRALHRDDSAVVYVEFLTAFPPMFLLFLGVVQIAFVGTGRMLVQHSANMAARSAAVVLPEDPALVNGRRDEVSYNDLDLGAVAGVLDALGETVGMDTSAIDIVSGDYRLLKIRLAAYKPLFALSPTPAQATTADENDHSISGAIGSAGERAAWGMLWNLYAVGVTFPSSPGANVENLSEDGPRLQTFTAQSARAPNSNGGVLTTRVSYLFNCGVPVVRKLICPLTGDRASIRYHHPEAAPEMETTVTQLLSPMYATLVVDPRFILLRADGTFAYQGAGYRYQSEIEGDAESGEGP